MTTSRYKYLQLELGVAAMDTRRTASVLRTSATNASDKLKDEINNVATSLNKIADDI